MLVCTMYICQIYRKKIELYDEPLLNSSVKNSIIFTVFGCNELILLLLQKFFHLLNVFCLSFVAFCFGSVSPCC